MACTIKIGVIAGTPVDTQMGVDFVKRQGFEALAMHRLKSRRAKPPSVFRA